METSKDTFEFGQARIIYSDEGVGVGVMVGFWRPGSLGLKDTRNVFGDEGGKVISGEEGLGEIYV